MWSSPRISPWPNSIHTIHIPLRDICRKHNIEYHSYDNDQQEYLSFAPTIDGDKERCLTTLQNCMQNIRLWMMTNLLKLNDSKSEFIMVGSKHNLLKTDAKNTAVQIGNDKITCVDSVCDLGFIIDSELKSTTHLNKLSSKLFVTIRKIAKIRHLIDKEMTKTLIASFSSQ